jgi:hypothetical protein
MLGYAELLPPRVATTDLVLFFVFLQPESIIRVPSPKVLVDDAAVCSSNR